MVLTVGGLLTSVAFIELASRYFPDIGLVSEHYRLFEFHLALNAILLAGAAYFAQKVGQSETIFLRVIPSLLISTSLSALSVVSIILASKSLFAMDIEKLWIVLLAAPAAVNALAGPAMLDEWEDDRPDDALEQRPEGPWSVPKQEDVNDPFVVLCERVFATLFVTALAAYCIILIGVGFFYYAVLDALLFSGQNMPLEQFGREAKTAFDNTLPYLIAAPLIVAAFSVVKWVISVTYQSILKIRHPMMDREPDTAEIDYIDNAFERLKSHIAIQEYPRAYRLICDCSDVLLLIWIGLLVGGINSLASYLPPVYETGRTTGTIADLYGNIDSYLPAIIGVVSGIFLTNATLRVAGHFAPRFAEYAFGRGWNTLGGANRNPDDYLETIKQFVRIGTLRTDQPFDPSKFLLMAFKEFERPAYVAALAVLIINAGVLFLNV